MECQSKGIKLAPVYSEFGELARESLSADPEVCVWHRNTHGTVYPRCVLCADLSGYIKESIMHGVETFPNGKWYAPGCGRKIKIKETKNER